MALLEEFEEQGNFLFRYRTWLPFIVLVFTVLLFYRQVGSGLALPESYWYYSLLVGLQGTYR